jgi:hypothetical protein
MLAWVNSSVSTIIEPTALYSAIVVHYLKQIISTTSIVKRYNCLSLLSEISSAAQQPIEKAALGEQHLYLRQPIGEPTRRQQAVPPLVLLSAQSPRNLENYSEHLGQSYKLMGTVELGSMIQVSLTAFQWRFLLTLMI